MQLITEQREVRHGHIFCGIGGGAKGFNRGHARVGNMVAKMRCVGGIDVDAGAIRTFERQARARGTVTDLFSLEQHRAFHGREPPPGWREADEHDVREAFDERPHILFLSAPCKGFSGLLSEKASGSPRYQALNALTLRAVDLALRAYADDPVELIVFENVPRIATRGRSLLDEIIALLRRHGYAVAETTHDCGELGGLAQSRKRFLLVARHQEKVPPFLYEPPRHRLRGVGEVLELLPHPLSGLGGPMHRMPALQWKTWVRLAFVEAGKDWRSLNDLAVRDGVLRDFGIVPGSGYSGSYGVRRWEEPARTIGARSGPTNNANSVADPRVRGPFSTFRVNEWEDPAGTITGQRNPSGHALSVADPRVPANDFHGLRVNGWAETPGAVTTQRSPGSSAQSVADPRVPNLCTDAPLPVEDPRAPDGKGWGKYHVAPADEPVRTVIAGSTTGNGAFGVADPRIQEGQNGRLGVIEWDDAAGTVRGEAHPSNGAFAVADVRVDGHRDSVQLGVRAWDQPAPVITSNMAAGAGPNSVADPRLRNGKRFNNLFRIVPWGEPSVAVAGPGGAAMGPAVADPRPAYRNDAHQSILRVTPWDGPRGAVTSATYQQNGAGAVADPRYSNWHPGASSSKLRVTEWEDAARPITGAQQVASGAGAVADPRPTCLAPDREAYLTGGHYGVVGWQQPGYAVTGSGQHDNGFNTVADPRTSVPASTDRSENGSLPAPSDRLVCVIVARDGTWHRPFTTLDLAAIQGMVDPEEQLVLEGLSDSAWREWIGNMVPPPAAEAVGSVMADVLLRAWAGETFALSSLPIWVRNVGVALSLKPQDLPHE